MSNLVVETDAWYSSTIAFTVAVTPDALYHLSLVLARRQRKPVLAAKCTN